MNGAAAAAGPTSSEERNVRPPISLDVRPIPPRDRYDRIMAAYASLAVDQDLDLVVDHDPQCMYYTLKATYGDDAFTFAYRERGPVTWRVRIRKHAAGSDVGHTASPG